MNILEELGKNNNNFMRLAKIINKDEEQSMDLLQEFYIKMHTLGEKNKLNSKNMNDAFYYITMKNLNHDMYHKKTKSPEYTEIGDNMEFEDDNGVEDKEAFEEFYSQIEHHLKKEMDFYPAKLIELNFLQGLSYRKISSGAKIPIRSILDNIKKGKNEIRETFQDEYNKYKKR